MDDKITRESLEWYRSIEDNITMQIARLDTMEARLYTIGSPTISDMPKGGNAVHDRTAELLARKVDLEKEIAEMERSQRIVREWLMDGIERMKDPKEKTTILSRYLDGEEWKSVTFILFGNEQDYLDRVDSYTRRTFLIHGSGLQALSKVLTENKEVEKIIKGALER